MGSACGCALPACVGTMAQPTLTVLQWNLGNKTTIRAMKSGLTFEVVLIIHVYTDLGLNQSGLISKVVVL